MISTNGHFLSEPVFAPAYFFFYLCRMNLAAPKQILNYIDGEFSDPENGRFMENVNPATGEVYSQTPDSDAADVQLAVDAAKKAFPAWSTSTPEYRFKILNKIAELIDANLDALALAESNDNGKPLWLSKRVDIPVHRTTSGSLPQA